MKNSKETISQRHKQLLYTLEKYREIHIDSLAQLLQISPTTLRRDLKLFEKRGIVQRFHGGARLIGDKMCIDSARSTHISTTEARAIVRQAAKYVNDGDTIFINATFPGVLMISYLQNKDVTIITNDPDAIHMLRGEHTRLILTGGEVHPKKNCLVGEGTVRFLYKMTADKAFIGTEGLHSQMGVTTSHMRETDIDELMVEQCRGDVYYLAMPDTLGKSCPFRSISPDQVHHIITTEGANPIETSTFESRGAHVEIVPVHEDDSDFEHQYSH